MNTEASEQLATNNSQLATPKRYLCRHIFTDGRRCGSICLRGEHFCYYHHTTRRPAANPKQRKSRSTTFELPLPDSNDRSAIQASIGMILQRIAANDIDPRRAGLILYGLSIAASTLPKAPAKPQRGVQEPDQVEEITTHPELGTLAPTAEFNPPQERLSLAGRLLAELRRPLCACDKKPIPNPQEDQQPETNNQPATDNQLATNNQQLATNVLTINAAAETRRHNRHHGNRKIQRLPRDKRATLCELPMDLSRNRTL